MENCKNAREAEIQAVMLGMNHALKGSILPILVQSDSMAALSSIYSGHLVYWLHRGPGFLSDLVLA